jgi:hypothetical protein
MRVELKKHPALVQYVTDLQAQLFPGPDGAGGAMVGQRRMGLGRMVSPHSSPHVKPLSLQFIGATMSRERTMPLLTPRGPSTRPSGWSRRRAGAGGRGAAGAAGVAAGRGRRRCELRRRCGFGGGRSTRQGLTLVHFSAQPELFLTQHTPYIPYTAPKCTPYPTDSAYVELKS